MLELIPYHSANTNGQRINDLRKYREVYFEIILKILRYLDPQPPIFIVGFPTFRSLIEHKGKLCTEFQDVIEFTVGSIIAIGTIDNRYRFIGLPFLNRPKGGVDGIVAAVTEAQGIGAGG